MKKIYIAIVLVLIASIFGIGFYNKKKLNFVDNNKLMFKVLAWEGYADNKFVKQFEKENNVNVEITYVKNDDELWNKLINNHVYEYDVIAANTAEISRYIEANLIQPINLNNIPNIKNQTQQFSDLKNLKEIYHNNSVFAVPYAYAEMGLIYNKKIISTPPTSMLEMWNTKYKGKVLAYDTYQHNFSFTALALGMKDPFNLSKEQLKEVALKLVDLKRNVLSFYTTIEEVNTIFRDYEIALVYANFGRQQFNELKKMGTNIGYIIPNESALAWLDCWAITKNSNSKELAEKWINFTLSKEVSANLTLTHGLSNTIKDNYGQNDKSFLTWLRPIKDPELRKSLWDEIQKGNSSFNL